MPVVKAPSFTFDHLKSCSPYDMNRYSSRAPYVRIHTPSLDGSYGLHDISPFDGYDDPQISLSQWINPGPMYSEAEVYESAQCPPSVTSHQIADTSPYEEPIDTGLFAWPYEGPSGYDSSFSSVPEPGTYSNAYSPTISVVSCSPRSDHSGLSLSPQPNLHEYSNAFNFGFATSVRHQFPSTSSTPWASSSCPPIHHSPKSTLSHSPTLSCSSIDAREIKLPGSRETSPSRPGKSSAGSGAGQETDAQAQRRRFPCLILGCERRFTSQYTLKVHMEAHKPKPRASFPCTLGCSERFSRQHDRLRHEVAKHGKVCEFLCDECGRFFSTKKTLGNHKCPVAQGGTRWVNN